MKKYRTAITIRAFSLTGTDLQDLLKFSTITYTNTTGRRLTEQDLASILADVDIVIAGTEPFSRKVLDQAPNLKIISRVGVGVDSIDLEAAQRRNIAVLSTPLAPVTAVAEHTLALILCLLKRIPHLNDLMKQGDAGPVGAGVLLSGKSIGIVGMGRIGQKTAELLNCLGCRISYLDPVVSGNHGHGWIKRESLEDLVSGCDIVSLHAPGLAGNRPMFDDRTFASCRRGIVIVNTARGSLIDDDALMRALDNGTVAGAALDVQSVEPYNGPLVRYPQVILTPHIASNTVESRQQMEKEAVTNIIKKLEEMP